MREDAAVTEGACVPAQPSTNEDLVAALKELTYEIKMIRRGDIAIDRTAVEHKSVTYPTYAGKEIINALMITKEWVKTVECLLSVGQGPFPPTSDVIAALSTLSGD